MDELGLKCEVRKVSMASSEDFKKLGHEPYLT